MPLRLIGGALIKWVGGGTIAAVLLGGAAWIYYQHQANQLTEAQAEVATLTLSRDAWRMSSATKSERITLLVEEREAARTSVKQLQRRLAEMGATYRERIRAINAAPEADDGPVAPVLRDALEGLP